MYGIKNTSSLLAYNYHYHHCLQHRTQQTVYCVFTISLFHSIGLKLLRLLD